MHHAHCEQAFMVSVWKNIENGFFPTLDNAIGAANNSEMGVNHATGEDG
ncbi:hypothetical protein [Allocoleopsis sp.]